jgi:hypothetical protein
LLDEDTSRHIFWRDGIVKSMNVTLIDMPPARGTFKKAGQIKKSDGQQGELGL